jgi:hypothetical protein
MDIFGRLSLGIGNVEYYLLLVDDYTRYSTAYGLKLRDQALSYLEEYKTNIETLHNSKIKFLCCDNAPEFVEGQFLKYVKECGTTSEKSVPKRHNPPLVTWYAPCSPMPISATSPGHRSSRQPFTSRTESLIKAIPPDKSSFEL